MAGKSATLIGATGLIGGHLLELLHNDDYFGTVKVLVRREVRFNFPDIKVEVVDFNDPDGFRSAASGSDLLFCATGTTRKKVKGDMAAYRKVDYDIPVHAAQICKETGCPHLLLVSSVGADSKSGNYYLKLKGEVEEKIKEMNIPSVSVFRPSMLLGNRKEFRLGEIIAKIVTVPFSFLFPSKYKPVQAQNVAKAMVEASKRNLPGFRIYNYREMVRH